METDIVSLNMYNKVFIVVGIVTIIQILLQFVMRIKQYTLSTSLDKMIMTPREKTEREFAVFFFELFLYSILNFSWWNLMAIKPYFNLIWWIIAVCFIVILIGISIISVCSISSITNHDALY